MNTSGGFRAGEGDRDRPAGRPFAIGVAGGSGSGKSTICQAILDRIGPEYVALIAHDAYYRHRPEISYEERTKVNYDHPDSLETELLLAHLEGLAAGETIQHPLYDFTRHLRRTRTLAIPPRPVILIEGILTLVDPDLREWLDLRVFVDTDADLRVLRRVERDMRERGRSLESITAQYQATVKPMHERFVVPSKRHADLIIPEGYNHQAVGALVALIREVLNRP